MRRRRGRPRLLVPGLVLAAGIGIGAGAILWLSGTRGGPALPAGDPDLRIEVLNGCGIPGAGDQMASLLRRGGFRVEQVGNADHFHYHEDIVIARTVARERAEAVARWIPGGIAVEQRVAAYPYDVTVIVGRPHPVLAAD